MAALGHQVGKGAFGKFGAAMDMVMAFPLTMSVAFSSTMTVILSFVTTAALSSVLSVVALGIGGNFSVKDGFALTTL